MITSLRSKTHFKNSSQTHSIQYKFVKKGIKNNTCVLSNL